MQIAEKEQACLLASRLLARDVHCVLVSAPHSGEGVSFVCADLARALSELHRRVLWICVEHKPFWNASAGYALGDYLQERCNWEELVQPWENQALLKICGTEDDLPSHLFHPRMALLMEKLRSSYDVILIDVPPINQRADGAAFFRFCDGNILISGAGKSVFDEIGAYAALLRESGAETLGSVLNGVRAKQFEKLFFLYTRKESETA